MNINLFLQNLKTALAGQKFLGLRVMIIGAETKEVLRAMEDTQSILRESKIRTWAQSDLLPGENRALYIDYGFDEATLVFVFVTSEIEVKGQHQAFIKKSYAFKEDLPEGYIYIIPIVLENCEIPRRLNELSPIYADSVNSVATLVPVLARKQREQEKLSSPHLNWK